MVYICGQMYDHTTCGHEDHSHFDSGSLSWVHFIDVPKQNVFTSLIHLGINITIIRSLEILLYFLCVFPDKVSQPEKE